MTGLDLRWTSRNDGRGGHRPGVRTRCHVIRHSRVALYVSYHDDTSITYACISASGLHRIVHRTSYSMRRYYVAPHGKWRCDASQRFPQVPLRASEASSDVCLPRAPRFAGNGGLRGCLCAFGRSRVQNCGRCRVCLFTACAMRSILIVQACQTSGFQSEGISES